jgi:copper oxidase (laccase) domain-containing protein
LAVTFYTKADEIPEIEGVHLDQVHGNRTVIVRAPSNRTEEADGMITDVPGLALNLRVADCQSFVIFSPKKNVLGLLHVGWRGLISGAIPEFFAVLTNNVDMSPADVFIGAGPSLCQKCADFTDPIKELPGIPERFISGKHADLQAAATEEFLSLGVRPEHFERHPDCTRCHPEKYWTYRGGDREAVKNGRTNMLSCLLT